MRSIGKLFVVTSCLVPACTVETRSPRPHPVAAPDDGSVTLDWTIDGVKNADSCTQSSASSIDVIVQTDGGDFVGEYQEACSAFATQIALPPGRYAASAVLVDGGGADRTTAVNVDPFRVVAGTDLVLPIDFPARSFE